MDRKVSRPHIYISVGIVIQNWIQATTISYIGREEYSGKDIAQVSQIEDVMEILLEKNIQIFLKILVMYILTPVGLKIWAQRMWIAI